MANDNWAQIFFCKVSRVFGRLSNEWDKELLSTIESTSQLWLMIFKLNTIYI